MNRIATVATAAALLASASATATSVAPGSQEKQGTTAGSHGLASEVSRARGLSSSTLNVKRPAATAAGDVMVVAVSARLGAKAPILAPTGWTLVRRDTCAQGTGSLTQAIFVKGLVPTDPMTFRWQFRTRTSAAASFLAYRGIDASAPVTSHTGTTASAVRAFAAPSTSVDAAGAVVAGFFGRTSNQRLRLQQGTVRRVAADVSATHRVGVRLSVVDAPANAAGKTGAWHVKARGRIGCGIGQLVALRLATQAGASLAGTTGAAAVPPSTVSEPAPAPTAPAPDPSAPTEPTSSASSTDAAAAGTGTPATGAGATAPVYLTPPVISGQAEVGSKLTGSNGQWSGAQPMTFQYRWKQCDGQGRECETIDGATQITYVIRPADAGHRLGFVVKATNTYGTTFVRSSLTNIVGGSGTAPPPPPSPSPPPPAPAPPPPPPPAPPPPGDSVVLVDQAFVCTGPVNLSLVKVTMRTTEQDAVRLLNGCTGRIGRVEVDTWTYDGIKIGRGSHDIIVEGGYVNCPGLSTGAHQDGIQAMSGTNISLRNLRVDCGHPSGGNANLFISNCCGDPLPTNVVCDRCTLAAGNAHTLFIASSVRSGARNSVLCVGRFDTIRIESNAQQVVNENNVVVPASYPGC
jgi:hypothetical protein